MTSDVCRICLTTEGKFVPLNTYKLYNAFLQLIGTQHNFEERLPNVLCLQCCTLVLKYNKLREKSVRAQLILHGILQKYQYVTKDTIRDIDRDTNNLVSNLSYSSVAIDNYNLTIKHDELESETEIKSLEPEIKIEEIVFESELKVETDSYNELYKIDTYSDNEPLAFKSDTERSSPELKKKKTKPKKAGKEKKHKKLKTKVDNKKKVLKSKITKKKRNKNVIKQPKIDRRRKPFTYAHLFTVTNLTYEEQKAEILARQNTTSFINGIFRCMECYKGFQDEDAYNSHMIRHSDQWGMYACDICKNRFPKKRGIDLHITRNHSQRYSCNSCDFVSTIKNTVMRHGDWHKGMKYQCPHCAMEFVHHTTYMGHIRIKHPSDFVCELCGYSFVSAKGIKHHKIFKHRLDDTTSPPEGPRCSPCNVRFVSESAYEKHLQVSARHENKEYNDSEPKRRQGMKSRKSNGPPMPCEQCGTLLEDPRSYHRHFLSAHPDKNRTKYPSFLTPHMCDLCGRMFASAILLDDHIKIHMTGENPHKCDICGKSFTLRMNLMSHKRLHSKQKVTYPCHVCGKHFSTQQNKKRHLFIHTGRKPFDCDVCGKSFRTEGEKRTHHTHVHLKLPYKKRVRQRAPPPLGGSEMTAM